MTSERTIGRPLTGRKVILGFVLFFVVLIGVQAAFIAVAISTHTGLVSEQPYRKGLNYSQRIALSQEQKNRQWRETWKISEDKKGLTFEIRDRNDGPIRFLELSAVISRPAHKNEDAILAFSESQDGSYSAPLAVTGSGAYVVDLEARRSSNGDPVWRSRRRLWIKP